MKTHVCGAKQPGEGIQVSQEAEVPMSHLEPWLHILPLGPFLPGFRCSRPTMGVRMPCPAQTTLHFALQRVLSDQEVGGLKGHPAPGPPCAMWPLFCRGSVAQAAAFGWNPLMPGPGPRYCLPLGPSAAGGNPLVRPLGAALPAPCVVLSFLLPLP